MHCSILGMSRVPECTVAVKNLHAAIAKQKISVANLSNHWLQYLNASRCKRALQAWLKIFATIIRLNFLIFSTWSVAYISVICRRSSMTWSIGIDVSWLARLQSMLSFLLLLHQQTLHTSLLTAEIVVAVGERLLFLLSATFCTFVALMTCSLPLVRLNGSERFASDRGVCLALTLSLAKQQPILQQIKKLNKIIRTFVVVKNGVVKHRQ